MGFSQQEAARQLRHFDRVWQRVIAGDGPEPRRRPTGQPDLPLMPRRRTRCCPNGGRR